ncbi:Uncharacterized protein APZ42_001334, partial [Daphnia magna]
MTRQQQSKLRCLQWNASSLNKANYEEFKKYLCSIKPQIIFLSETHWKSQTNFSFPGYALYRTDRTDKKGGGVALLISLALNPTSMRHRQIRNLEWVGASFYTPPTQRKAVRRMSDRCRGRMLSTSFLYPSDSPISDLDVLRMYFFLVLTALNSA